MKKHLLFLPCFLLFVTLCHSQKERPSLDISFGPALPLGQYADKNFNNSKAGFAAIGQQLNVSYLYKINHRFGLSATLYAQRNPLDRDALAREFGNQNMNTAVIFTTTVGTPPVTPGGPSKYYKDWSFEKHAWMAASLLLGGEGELPLNTKRNFSFIPKVMIGIIAVKSPGLKGQSVTDTASAYVMQNSVSAVGFSYLLRAGVNYKLRDNIGFILAFDYLGTNNITFKNVKNIFSTLGSGNLANPTASQGIRTGNARQILQSINLSAGIRFLL